MKIKVEQKDLFNALKSCKGIINNKSTYDILQCINIKTDGKETLKITATNLDTTLITSVPAVIEEAGEAIIKFDILHDYISQLPKQEMIIKEEENKITIECGKSTFEISTQDKELFPRIEKGNNKEEIEINILKDDLVKLINETIFAASKDTGTRPELLGINIITDGEKITAYGCDGYRISRSSIKIETDNKINIIVPAKILGHLIKNISEIEDDEIIFNVLGEEKLRIKAGEMIYIINLIQGSYINAEQILSAKIEERSIIVNKNELLEVLNRIEIIQSKANDPLCIKILQDNVELLMQSNIGKVKENIEPKKIINKDEEFQIAVNPVYISETLQNIDTEEVILKFNSNTEPIIIMKADRNDYTGLILPVKINR